MERRKGPAERLPNEMGPSSRVPPPRVEVPEEVAVSELDAKHEAVPAVWEGTTPSPQPKREVELDESRVSRRSRDGFTLDTYIIADGGSRAIRRLWEAGFLKPRSYSVADGRVYEAYFTDRNRSLIITKETYDVMQGFQLDDSNARDELTTFHQALVDAPAEGKEVNALKMVEHGPWENEVIE
jgi:hypothetical protein